MIICKICDKHIKNYRGMSSHIRHKHNMAVKQYYDKYMKKENENICTQCGKKTKFIGIREGYRRFCSPTCASKNDSVKEKTKKTNLKKFGGTTSIHSKQIQNKIKQTNLEKYGVENVFASQTIKVKLQETNLKKYGTKFPTQNKNIKKKRKKTNLKRYGVDNPTKNKTVRNKTIRTCLEKYGVENPNQCKDIRNKLERTNLERHGVPCVFELENVKEKIKQTYLEKYGVENPAKLDSIKQKRNQTNLKRYGVACNLRTPDMLNKRKQRIYNNQIEFLNTQKENFIILSVPINNTVLVKCKKCGWEGHTDLHNQSRQKVCNNNLRCYGCYPPGYKTINNTKSSIPQEHLYKLIYNSAPFDGCNNYNVKCCKKSIDITLTYKNIKIALEYDGWYRHQEINTKRDNILVKNNYHVLHILSKKELPTKQELFKILDDFVGSKEKIYYHYMPDWKE